MSPGAHLTVESDGTALTLGFRCAPERKNVVDLNARNANTQWTDHSGADPGSGRVWYYQVTTYNSTCPAEGPFWGEPPGTEQKTLRRPFLEESSGWRARKGPVQPGLFFSVQRN